jgi:hypothetical protein
LEQLANTNVEEEEEEEEDGSSSGDAHCQSRQERDYDDAGYRKRESKGSHAAWWRATLACLPELLSLSSWYRGTEAEEVSAD